MRRLLPVTVIAVALVATGCDDGKSASIAAPTAAPTSLAPTAQPSPTPSITASKPLPKLGVPHRSAPLAAACAQFFAAGAELSAGFANDTTPYDKPMAKYCA